MHICIIHVIYNTYIQGWPVGFPEFLLQAEFQKYGNVVLITTIITFSITTTLLIKKFDFDCPADITTIIRSEPIGILSIHRTLRARHI